MEMQGEQLIPLPQQATWDALNDTAVLKDCIPGCDAIDRQSDQEYLLTMTARVGPVSARFKGRMQLVEVDAPRTYTLRFEGQGGLAGFAKGEARVELVAQGEATRLCYGVKAHIGGKLAQVGARLIDGVARKMAEQFFSALTRRVSPAEK